MTKKQLQLLDYIREYRRSNRVSPSYPEMANYFKKSKSTIWEHLHSLVVQGYLIRSKDFQRGYKLTNRKP